MRFDAETIRVARASEGEEPPGRLRLLVFGEQALAVLPLPDSGVVVLGRGAEADLVIDDPSVSRRHAELELGPPLRIRDLGSFNGTRVRGKSLGPQEWATLAVGDSVELGTLTAIVQRYEGQGAAGRPRQVLGHGYFEARLEEQCARAARTGERFSVLRVKVGASDEAVAGEVLAGALEDGALVASWGPGELEVLLLDAPAERAVGVAATLEQELARRGAAGRVGVAVFPRDGRSPEELIALAGEAAQPSGNAGAKAKVVVLDAAMQKLHAVAARVAQSPLSVILLGETGVGKEVIAEAIHQRSARANGPFVRLNCAAFTETLLESELFGHEKGAFTGAVKAKAGLLESASGGTVFLDEVGELPLGVQAKLLRVIEQREVQRIGELRPRPIDVRFVSATNRELEAEVGKGTFRQDLFFRLNGFSLVIPPLRERPAEIEPLAKAFISRACLALGTRREPTLAAETVELLRRYPWPGNIRELRNSIDRAVVLCSGEVLLPEHFALDKMQAPLLPTPKPVPAPGASPLAGSTKGGGDRQRIIDALERCGGNQTEAAKLLSVSRKTLMAWMDAHQIPRPRKG